VRGRQPQGLGDIAGEHVGALHRLQLFFVSARDAFLDQALAQSNSQLAGDDLDQVLGFEWIGAAEQVCRDGELGRRPARLRYLAEFGFDLSKRQLSARALWSPLSENITRGRTQISMPTISR
jgi:hypothetical protein